MNKLVKGIVTSLIVLLALVTMPFSVSAEQYYPFSIDNIVGVNITVDVSTTTTGSSNTTIQYYYINHFNVVFDASYVGTMQLRFQYNRSDTGTGTVYTFNKDVYVNGNSVTVDVPLSGQYVLRNENAKVTAVNSSQVSQLNKLDFPFESYVPVTYAMANLDYTTMVGLYEWTYPAFLVKTSSFPGTNIMSFYMNPKVTNTFILGSSIQLNGDINSSNCNIRFYRLFNGSRYLYTVDSQEFLTSATYINSSDRFYWYKFTYTGDSTGGVSYIAIDSSVDYYYVPIYHANVTLDNISTDFALRFGLTNRLLNALDNIAPSNESQEASDQLDDKNDLLQDPMQDLFSAEDDYGNQMNQQLQHIDFSNPLQNNSSMLSSGNFVIQIFNGLIANNPISILIIIVCIILVARRLFG